MRTVSARAGLVPLQRKPSFNSRGYMQKKMQPPRLRNRTRAYSTSDADMYTRGTGQTWSGSGEMIPTSEHVNESDDDEFLVEEMPSIPIRPTVGSVLFHPELPTYDHRCFETRQAKVNTSDVRRAYKFHSQRNTPVTVNTSLPARQSHSNTSSHALPPLSLRRPSSASTESPVEVEVSLVRYTADDKPTPVLPQASFGLRRSSSMPVLSRRHSLHSLDPRVGMVGKLHYKTAPFFFKMVPIEVCFSTQHLQVQNTS